MAIPVTLLGITYNVPETGEKPWGQVVTPLLVSLATSVNTLVGGGAGVPLLQFLSSDSSLAAAATLSPIRNWHRIQGNGGPVTLGATTAIADGTVNGQLLLLTGTHALNTVTIQDNANTRINGNITIGLYDAMFLVWDSVVGDWIEIARNQ